MAEIDGDVPIYLNISCLVYIFSLPGRSPGRAIVLPQALALTLASALAVAKGLTLKFFM